MTELNQNIYAITIQQTSKFSVFTSLAMPNGRQTNELGRLVLSHKAQTELFDRLYEFFPTSVTARLSLRERKSGGNHLTTAKGGSLTYGEIVDIKLMKCILDILDEECLFNGYNTDYFYDLGSGSGRMVMASALTNTFQYCIGLEILTSLHGIAEHVKSSYEKLLAISEYSSSSCSAVEFYHADILDLTMHNWTNAGCIYINSTCFDDELMTQLCIGAMRYMRPGSIIITLSSCWPQERGFELIREIRHEMSWGMADVFIQRKV